MRMVNRWMTVSAIEQVHASAIIRTRDEETARRAMSAAVGGGFRMVEFTLTTPGALSLIREFSERPGLIVGAGTVLSVESARDAARAGACFLVSPVSDADVIAEAARLDLACIPGTFTPTEMWNAHRLGADFVKLFPAPPGGAEYVRAIRLPLPALRIFPTAGVTEENFTDFLDAGCAGVGFVANLFIPDELARGEFDRVRDRALRIHRRLDEWRRLHPS